VAVLQPKDLLPSDIGVRMEDRSWPYVKQVYGGGEWGHIHTHTNTQSCFGLRHWGNRHTRTCGQKNCDNQANPASTCIVISCVCVCICLCVCVCACIGDMCFLAGGRQAVRRTEVRLACSPTDRIHLLVREPDFCHYIFVIYSPALCTLRHYAPKSEPTPVGNA
jgi:hypothetical protein